jgi:hypothetical protein
LGIKHLKVEETVCEAVVDWGAVREVGRGLGKAASGRPLTRFGKEVVSYGTGDITVLRDRYE